MIVAFFARLTLILVLSAMNFSAAHANRLHIAVATNFLTTMQQLAEAYAAESGHDVQVSSGSTGKLYAQILHGAPFDLFASADQDRPARLVEQGLARKDTLKTYATGRLMLWSGSEDAELIALEDLSDQAFQHLAIANPALAPYGHAAKQTLQNLELWSDVQDRLVMAENVGQAYSLVASGNAEYGLVAYSQWIQRPQGSYRLVPAFLHDPVRQDVVMLNRTTEPDVARDFLEFLGKDEARQMILEAGYQTEPVR